MFNLDLMTLVYVLVLCANLSLILLVGHLAMERARDAWKDVASRARQTQAQLDHLQDITEAASIRTSESIQKIAEAERKLTEAEQELKAVKQRQDIEPIPFVYSATPPENFDLGGTIWEFVVQHEGEAHKETNPNHPARQWLNGRLYLVQAATQTAAKRQLERHLPEEDGFRVTFVKRHGDTLFAEAS